jgi:ankyrin repeat protein/beta-lactamase regulating signal transducer with metallopeptidase domain
METWLIKITNYLLAQSWQIAVLTIAVAVTSFLLRNKSAHIRYILWLIFLAKCLVPPLYMIPVAVLPEQDQPAYVPAPPVSERMISEYRVPDVVVSESPVPASVDPEVISSPAVTERQIRYDTRVLLAIGWIAGVIAFSFYYLLNAVRTQIWLLKRRKELPSEYQKKIESLFITYGVKKMPHVWLLERISQPFVWGLVRGSIYLPSELIDDKQMKFHTSLLGHELSHIIRLDAMINSLQVIAQVVFWFHPLVWWANRKIRVEREKCCDEMTIARTRALPEDYSEAIVEILAAKYEQARPVPSLAVAGQVKNIEERIKTMLRPGKKFYKRPSVIALTIILLLAILIVPIGCVLTRRSQTDTSEKGLVVKDFYTGLQRPDGIVCLNKDNLIVVLEASDEYSPGIIHCKRGDAYSPDDVFSGPGSPYNNPDGLIQLPDGRFIVTDGQAHTVFEVPKEGGPPKVFLRGVTSYCNPAVAPSGFDGPNVDPGDLLIPIWLPASIIAVNPTTKERKVFVDYSFFSSFCREGVGALEFGPDNNLYMVWSNYWEDKKPPRIYRFDSNGNGEIFLELDDFAYRTTGFNIEIDQSNGWLYYVYEPIQPSPYSGQGTIFRISLDGLVNELVVDLGLPCQNLELSPDGKNLYIGAVGKSNVIKEIQNVNLLPERGSQVSSFTKTDNIPAKSLCEAVVDGDIEQVKSLIKNGTNVNTKGNSGRTALHYAAEKGFTDIAELLISEGADVNARNESRGTPLHRAAALDHPEVVKLLIAKNVDVNARDNVGNTPLHLAARRIKKDAVELLMNKGADVNVRNNQGHSPLDFALSWNRMENAKLLLGRGAEISDIYQAIRLGDAGKVKDFIGAGTDVNLKNQNGSTSLHIAAAAGNTALLELLIEKGADVNAKNNRGQTALCIAVSNDNKEMVKLLIEQGADVNTKDENSHTPFDIILSRNQRQISQNTNHAEIREMLLANGAEVMSIHAAVQSEDMEKVKEFLQQGIDINSKDGNGQTALYIAVNNDNKEIVKLLIEQGADVNARNENGQSPLDITLSRNQRQISQNPNHAEIREMLLANGAKILSIYAAIQSGSMEKVKEFLQKGIDINSKDEDGDTPLIISVNRDNNDIAKLLIDKGADVNVGDEGNYTPLYYAIWNLNKDMVNLLISKGAEVNFSAQEGDSIFYEAVWMDDFNIVKTLVDNGAKYDVKDKDGFTALHYAASQGSMDMVTLFISKGIDTSSIHMAACAGDLSKVKEFIEQGTAIDAKDEAGWTALFWAACAGRTEVAEFLIENGADINSDDGHGRSILHQAVHANAVKLVELLISNGAGVNAKDKRANTPLHSNTHRDVAELLIARGADINAKNNSGQTPLYWASQRGNKDVAELLIDKGADINSKDNNGLAPLHLAARRGQKDMVEFLINKGADVNLRNNRGLTPMRIAMNQGHTEIVELLKKHGARE